MEYVGIGPRFVAGILDALLLIVVGYIVALVTGGTTDGGFSLQGASFFMWALLSLGYYTVFEASSGATIGKRIMKLKVVMLDPQLEMNWQAAIIRNALRIVDGLFLYVVAAISILTSTKKQRIGDRAAGTAVVRIA